MKDPHSIRLDTVGIVYTVSAAMYSTFCTCPKEVRLFLSNFVVRPGHMFLKTLDIDEEKGKMLSSEKHYPKKAFSVS